MLHLACWKYASFDFTSYPFYQRFLHAKEVNLLLKMLPILCKPYDYQNAGHTAQ